MNLTYKDIKPLLLSSRTEGSTLIAQFQAPGSDRIIEAQAYLQRSNTVKSQVIETVKRNVLYEVRSIAYNLVRQVLGSGAVGRISSTAVSSALSGPQMNTVSYSSEDKEAAILEAFKSVAHQFVFDPEKQVWKDAGDVSPMEEQLLRHPVREAFDKDLLARMLVQMAAADEHISEEERDFLMEELGLSPLQVDEFSLAEHPVLAAECEAVQPGVRETIFQLVYAIALADDRLDEKEKSLLNQYAQMLGLSPASVEKLTAVSKASFLDSALKKGVSWESLLAMGQQMGMEPKEVERAWVHYCKEKMK